MRKVCALLLLLLLPGLVVAVQAQLQPRNYVVEDVRYEFAPDSTTFAIRFTVRNAGGDALAETGVSLVGADGRVLNPKETQSLPPLAAGAAAELDFTFTTADYPPDSVQVFEIEVGIDLYELAGTDIARDNIMFISVPIPAGIRRPAPADSTPAPAAPEPATPAAAEAAFSGVRDGAIWLNGVILAGADPASGQIILNGTPYEPLNVLLALAGALVALLIVWLLTVVLRLAFRRKPRFGIWQPPYATMPTMDPGSVAGRRQAWQTHAQNGTILAAPTEGNLHPVKLLLSSDNIFMQHWHITAIRLSQYDNFGRVGRSETIAPRWMVNRLNGILRRNSALDNDALAKRVRPVARRLVQHFRRTVGKRSIHLPVALDVRFEGKQGEVRIAFELYQCQKFAWHRLDRWEPIMAVLGSRLLENYTYTVHGQSGGETMREFYRRLPDDVEWLLCETIRSRGTPPAEAPAPQPFNVPDTLSGLQPIVSEPAQMG
ncbi:MAG: hypothetical protein MUE40_19640 [Anaerolineae bacterium]|jgi:hypothetical protein|nr:hypothetical protein [Anaerolineae bacterium]